MPVPVDGSARVLSGEQSNTSVIVQGSPPVIVKLFRTLYDGANPDVVVQSALAAAGSTRVPTPSGWVEGTWNRPDGSAVSGHLAFASEFLVGTRDAWREASGSLAERADFGPQAHTLGQATAEVHRTLAEHLATEVASPARRSELVHTLRDRAAWACNQVDALAGLEPRIAAIHDQLDELVDFPVLQRIHGDYHLGQVLDAPDRGWVLLDFEGEPLRPISERSDPDLALRDVAGMLRSFDYAGPPGRGRRLSRPRRRVERRSGRPGAARSSASATPTSTAATRATTRRCWRRSSWTRRSTRSSTRRATARTGSTSRSAPWPA